jgi:hypothetical protein
VSGINVYQNAFGGLDISAEWAGSGLDLSSFSFGWIGSDGQNAIIRGGYFKAMGMWLRIGDAENTVACGGSENNRHLVVVEIRADNPRFLPNTVTASTFKGDTADAIRVPLYEVYLDEGEVVRHEVLHIGTITP